MVITNRAKEQERASLIGAQILEKERLDAIMFQWYLHAPITPELKDKLDSILTDPHEWELEDGESSVL